MAMAMQDRQTQHAPSQRQTAEQKQPQYTRCEICDGPIARGEIPPGPYEPFFVMCHNNLRGGKKCGHNNRFPR